MKISMTERIAEFPQRSTHSSTRKRRNRRNSFLACHWRPFATPSLGASAVRALPVSRFAETIEGERA